MTALAAIWVFVTAAMKLRLVRWSLYLAAASLAFKTGMVAELVCDAGDPVFQQPTHVVVPSTTD